MSFTEALFLSVTSTGKVWGIEMPHRNLLVMERTYYRYMYLQHGEAGTIPLYVDIVHVLLHRLGANRSGDAISSPSWLKT